MYARIIQGRVADLFDEMPTLGQAECALIVECPNETQAGWLFEAGEVRGPDTEEGMLTAIVSIAEAYSLVRKGLKDRMVIAQLQDGENEATVRAALAAEWQQTNADEELEILSLLGG